MDTPTAHPTQSEAFTEKIMGSVLLELMARNEQLLARNERLWDAIMRIAKYADNRGSRDVASYARIEMRGID